MAGVWKRDGTVAVTNGNKKVTGTGTTFADTKNGVAKGHLFCITSSTSVDFYEVDYVVSNTELYLVQAYRGVTATGKAYEIITTFSDSVPEFARRLTATLSAYQQQSDAFQALLTSTATTVEVTAPDGTKQTLIPWKRVTSEGEGQTARAKVEADRAKTEADRAAAAANATAEAGTGSLMRVGGATILDAERYALERATGGRQTIIRDSAGNANAMFVLPRFSYADLGMTADMGTGDVTAFDFGSGSIKGEIFIGAYLASGSGAVSAPRQDPRNWLDHTAASNACSAKGAGWHLMTAHEWAAIALWCMANGYEPIGNTNWGRSHAQAWKVGDRADNRAPGDAAGTGRTKTGSMGSEATHTRTLGGIADLVGNVWEWQDGLLLQDGRFKISAYNTQAEVDWAFVDAYLDASTPTGGSAVLSNAVNNRLGAIGDNANAGNSAIVEWRSMTKAGGYVSLQALRRLLVEPASVLPQGRIYMRNFGERLPYRGGTWGSGAIAGLAALALSDSRVYTLTGLGFRPAFA
ncbi:hypothetical protein [Aeromonas caviae]|uniref:hypothetical protein n=1 Tax=Aeromonas caviae TaxID=648 RepID=UPI002B23F7C5|nr:hypothetical protein [Aeromonas caviae]MEA9426264.1 hypothetical protein [Aeromonas caviae]MEA9431154.1 hypothetical protein [Aeromonas caviae]